VLVSKRALRKVSPEDIETLRDVAAPHLRALTLKTREQNIEAVDEMKKEGVEVISVEDAVRDRFYQTGRGAWKDGVGELYPQSLLERVVAVVEEYREQRTGSAER
jgi:TRAP-type C4-dicarboxylate transport system substrate-binding protein